MKPLPLRPLPMPTEALTDYLERLASANGYQGLELWHILDQGDYSHPELLSHALKGHPLPIFSGPSNSNINIPVNTFGLQSSDFTRVHRRWCPLCIENSRWMRPIWRLKLATICTTHRIHLLQQCPACHAYPTHSSILSGACECGIQFMRVPVRASRQEIRITELLAASLGGTATLDLGETVASLSAPQVVRLVCYAGRLIEGPTLHRPGQIRGLEELPVASTLIAGTATLLADWPSSFWRCLERFVEATPADASVRRVFSPLYQVIYQDLRDTAFQFLRDAFELFLLDHWRGELCGRHRLFDKKTITAHSRHGLARVARAHGIGNRTLRRMVHQAWLPANHFASSPKRQLITIDEKKLSAFIPDPDDYLDLRSVARFLGIKRTRLRELIGLGAIMADALPTWRRRNQWYFRRNHVFEFLGEIRRAAAPTLTSQASVTLNHVLQCWRVTTAELSVLLVAMRENEVPFTMTGPGQLRDAVFDETILRSWLHAHRRKVTEWVSVTTAAEILELKEEVVYELVAKNLLEATLFERKGRIIRRISLPSLQRFQEEYVSLAALAKQSNVSSSALLKRLVANPVTGPRIDGGRQYFFRRKDVDESLQATVEV